MSTESGETSEKSGEVAADRYCVVVYGTPDDPHVLRDVLVERIGLHPTDAMVLVHAAPGLLPDGFPAETARDTAAAIASAGIDAEALPESDIPDLSDSETVHHARCLDDGFEIVELHGERETLIPWSEIQLVNVGHVPEDPVRHYRDENMLLTAARRSPRPPVESEGSSGPEMWIVSGGSPQGYFIDHGEMNYEYLGARMTGSGTSNFRLLVQDVAQKTSANSLTPSAQAFLQHGLLKDYQFSSSEAFKRDTIFQLLRKQRHTDRGCSMNDTEFTGFAETFRKAHVALERQLDRLKAELEGESDSARLQQTLKSLEKSLGEHFDFEEQGGYMSEVLKRMPNIQAEVDQLAAQHGEMLRKLRETRDAVAERGDTGQLRAGLAEWVALLKTHEDLENEIVQQTFNRDVGVAD